MSFSERRIFPRALRFFSFPESVDEDASPHQPYDPRRSHLYLPSRAFISRACQSAERVRSFIKLRKPTYYCKGIVCLLYVNEKTKTERVLVASSTNPNRERNLQLFFAGF